MIDLHVIEYAAELQDCKQTRLSTDMQSPVSNVYAARPDGTVVPLAGLDSPVRITKTINNEGANVFPPTPVHAMGKLTNVGNCQDPQPDYQPSLDGKAKAEQHSYSKQFSSIFGGVPFLNQTFFHFLSREYEDSTKRDGHK